MAVYLEGEKAFQFTKLLKSGASLADVMTLFRVASVASSRRLMSEKDAKKIEDVRQRLEKLNALTYSRQEAQAKELLRFKPEMSLKNREEHIAQWLANTTGYVPYGKWEERYGVLVARAQPYKRQPPRKGTFKTVAGKTVVKGFDKVKKDLKELSDTIARMILRHGKDRKGFKEAKGIVGKATRSIEKSGYKG